MPLPPLIDAPRRSKAGQSEAFLIPQPADKNAEKNAEKKAVPAPKASDKSGKESSP
jgi:hypothetical protein